MKLLLISNSTNFGEPYLAWCQTPIEFFCEKNGISANSNILFFPFAGIKIGEKKYPESYDAYETRVKEVFGKWGYKNLTSIHNYEDKIDAIEKADCLVVGGGNTFHLYTEMYNFSLMEKMRE